MKIKLRNIFNLRIKKYKYWYFFLCVFIFVYFIKTKEIIYKDSLIYKIYLHKYKNILYYVDKNKILHIVDIKTGEIKYKLKIKNYNYYFYINIIKDVLYYDNTKKLVAININTFKTIYEYIKKEKYKNNNYYISKTCKILNNNYFYINNNYLYCVNLKNKKLKWKFKFPTKLKKQICIYLKIKDNNIYFNDLEKLYNLDLKTGQIKWIFNSKLKHYYFFAPGFPLIKNKNIYFNNGESIFALDKENGKLKWIYNNKKKIGLFYGGFQILKKNIFVKTNNNICLLNKDTGKITKIYNNYKNYFINKNYNCYCLFNNNNYTKKTNIIIKDSFTDKILFKSKGILFEFISKRYFSIKIKDKIKIFDLKKLKFIYSYKINKKIYFNPKLYKNMNIILKSELSFSNALIKNNILYYVSDNNVNIIDLKNKIKLKKYKPFFKKVLSLIEKTKNNLLLLTTDGYLYIIKT